MTFNSRRIIEEMVIPFQNGVYTIKQIGGIPPSSWYSSCSIGVNSLYGTAEAITKPGTQKPQLAMMTDNGLTHMVYSAVFKICHPNQLIIM